MTKDQLHEGQNLLQEINELKKDLKQLKATVSKIIYEQCDKKEYTCVVGRDLSDVLNKTLGIEHYVNIERYLDFLNNEISKTETKLNNKQNKFKEL